VFRPVFHDVPHTDDDIAPDFQLDEAFVRGAQFKEPSARGAPGRTSARNGRCARLAAGG